MLVLLAACSQERTQTTLFDVDSLIISQATELTAVKAVLHKEAFVGTGKDDTIYSPSTKEAWAAELEMFKKLDAVNKPVSKFSYIIDDSLFDVSSNLTVKAISAVSDDLPVKYIRIFYDDDIKSPRKIEALYDDRNEMYASGKILKMEFQEIDDKNILTGYTIQGGQKMILGDSVTYVIQGKIVIK
jgi:hypothetical protein